VFDERSVDSPWAVDDLDGCAGEKRKEKERRDRMADRSARPTFYNGFAHVARLAALSEPVIDI
jgi:hypothetical protein